MLVLWQAEGPLYDLCLQHYYKRQNNYLLQNKTNKNNRKGVELLYVGM